MTDFARGLKWGGLGARGEGGSGNLSAARPSRLRSCANAREPSPPAEARRNVRRLKEQTESVHAVISAMLIRRILNGRNKSRKYPAKSPQPNVRRVAVLPH